MKNMKTIFSLQLLILSVLPSLSQVKMVELSHYLFPEFTQGVILLKNGSEYKPLLNYNSLTEEMVFDENGKKMAISKAMVDQVDTVFIKNRKFITFNNTFIELIFHSKVDLYVEHKCYIKDPGKPSGYGGTSQTSAITSYSTLISDGLVYDLNLPEGYEAKPYLCYWLMKEGKYKSIANMGQLKDLYQDKSDLLKEFVKKNKVKFNNQESIIQLIEYLETH